MTAYYSKDGIDLYHGDAREIVLQMAPADVVITDPVWPNSLPMLAGSDDPAGLFAAVAQHFPRVCKRAVVQLGCDSDPRLLLGMPREMPFFRVCWIPYPVPTQKGRLLYSGDVAYAFGAPPPSRPGRRLIDGECRSQLLRTPRRGHPCPRYIEHVRWLVSRFAAGPVLDPFAGIGTTLLAAKLAGLPAAGVEIEEKYCERAARRLDNTPAHLFPEKARA